MFKKKDIEIIKEYEYMFDHYFKKEIPFYPIKFGFECNNGWFGIIEKLISDINKIDIDNKIIVEQIKEKFGGLRFYYTFNGDSDISKKIYDLVTIAESVSYKTCENCGCQEDITCKSRMDGLVLYVNLALKKINKGRYI